MKPLTILLSLTAFSLAPLAPIFSAETPLKTVNVAVPAVSLLQSPLFVAIDAGAFKKYGMEVRYIVTGARTIQALVGAAETSLPMRVVLPGGDIKDARLTPAQADHTEDGG